MGQHERDINVSTPCVIPKRKKKKMKRKKDQKDRRLITWRRIKVQIEECHKEREYQTKHHRGSHYAHAITQRKMKKKEII